MKLSARNQLLGKVESLDTGAVSAVVKIDFGGFDLKACISMGSYYNLALEIGDAAYAIFSSHDVLVFRSNLMNDIPDSIKGTVTTVARGAVCAQVTVGLIAGCKIDAMMLDKAVQKQNLGVGDVVTVYVNPNNISIGTA